MRSDISIIHAAILGCAHTLAMLLSYGMAINLIMDNPRQGLALLISLFIFHLTSNRLRGCPEVWDVRDAEGGENEY